MQSVALPVAFRTLLKGHFPKGSFGHRAVQFWMLKHQQNFEDNRGFLKNSTLYGHTTCLTADVSIRHDRDVSIQVKYTT